MPCRPAGTIPLRQVKKDVAFEEEFALKVPGRSTNAVLSLTAYLNQSIVNMYVLVQLVLGLRGLEELSRPSQLLPTFTLSSHSHEEKRLRSGAPEHLSTGAAPEFRESQNKSGFEIDKSKREDVT